MARRAKSDSTPFWFIAFATLIIYWLLRRFIMHHVRARVEIVDRTGLGSMSLDELVDRCADCHCPAPDEVCRRDTRCCSPITCARTNNCTMSKEEAEDIATAPINAAETRDDFFREAFGVWDGTNPTRKLNF